MAKKYIPWNQQTDKEKIESLHVQAQQIGRAINQLGRAIMPFLDQQRREGLVAGKETKT